MNIFKPTRQRKVLRGVPDTNGSRTVNEIDTKILSPEPQGFSLDGFQRLSHKKNEISDYMEGEVARTCSAKNAKIQSLLVWFSRN